MTACPKPRPKLLDRRKVKADTAKLDREENAKVKARSKGQCEVRFQHRHVVDGKVWAERRCALRASQVHHLISGIGRRNVGASIKAGAKLHLCDRCHAEIHGHVLKPTDEATRYDAAMVRFERIT